MWLLVVLAVIALASQLSVGLPVEISSLSIDDIGPFVDSLSNDRLLEILKETIDSLVTKEDISPENGIRLNDLYILEKLHQKDKQVESQVEVEEQVNPWAAVGAPTPPNIPSKVGLASTCNNLACDVVYRALVSSSIPIIY